MPAQLIPNPSIVAIYGVNKSGPKATGWDTNSKAALKLLLALGKASSCLTTI
jgi:hypothetical protein